MDFAGSSPSSTPCCREVRRDDATYGPIGRLGRYTATHFRTVAIAWASSPSALGVLAPRVETALSGAGWEATGSESVAARKLIDSNFAGPVLERSDGRGALARRNGRRPGLPRAVAVDAARAEGRSPREGRRGSRSRECRSRATGTPRSSRPAPRADANAMVRAADDLKAQLRVCRRGGVPVSLTGACGHVVGLQRRQPHGDDEDRAVQLAGDAGDPRAGVRLARRRRPAADAHDPRSGRLGRLALPRHAAARTSRSGR